jgi:hypothetical protein
MIELAVRVLDKNARRFKRLQMDNKKPAVGGGQKPSKPLATSSRARRKK